MKTEKRKETYYLVEVIKGKEYNIFYGTAKECNAEMKEQKEKYNNTNEMYLSIDRFEN